MQAQPAVLLFLACIQASCAFVPSLTHRPLYRTIASVQSCSMQADAPDLAFSRREVRGCLVRAAHVLCPKALLIKQCSMLLCGRC